MKSELRLLRDLIKDKKLFPAASKTVRYGSHYEFLVAIGDNETASICMTKEGFEDLEALLSEE